MTLATSTSRVAGFVRDHLNGRLFGAGWVSDAYFMAIRIPSMLRELFAEGALSNAFIPTLSARLEKGKREEAWHLMSQVFTLLLLVTGALVALGILFAPQLVGVIAKGFAVNPDKFQLTVLLTRYLFPTLLFVSLAALWMGALNSLHRFSVPAFMNLTQIAMGVLLLTVWRDTEPGGDLRNIQLWTLAMTLGFLLQWLVQVPSAGREGIRVRWSWPPDHPGIREILRLMGPAVLSQSVLQVNLLVNQFFASFLAAGFVSYFYYGNRLFQLPFGVLGVSVATVTFPLLSRLSAKGKLREFSGALQRALTTSLFLMVPCTVGIWIVAEPACRLLFEYGRFNPENTRYVTQATVLYALGLSGYACNKILLPAYYARGDTRRPVTGSVIGMIVNAGLNLSMFLLVQETLYRFWGLALASSLGAFANLAVLTFGLRRIGVSLEVKRLVTQIGKILSASLLMGALAWAVMRFVSGADLPGSRLWNFLLPTAAGGGLYYFLAKVWRLEGLDWVMDRKGKKQTGGRP